MRGRGARWALLMILIMAFICGGNLIIWTSGQPRVRVQLIRTLTGAIWRVDSVAFSPDGRLLAAGSCSRLDSNDLCAQGGVKLWEVESGVKWPVLISQTDMWVRSVAFSPDGQLLASGDGYGIVELWDMATRRRVRTLSGRVGDGNSVIFSPDGQLLASGAYKEINLYEVSTGELVRNFSGHPTAVNSVAFSPDGELLASGSCRWLSVDGCLQGEIKLWEVSTGQLVRTLTGHTGYVTSVAFSPDGFLASASSDKTIKLWEVPTGNPIGTLSGSSWWVNSVAFSPDGTLLASNYCGRLFTSGGCKEGGFALWDVETAQEVYTGSGHTGGVNSVAFSPTGRLLATGSSDKTVKLWEIQVENQPPQAKFSFSPTQPTVGQSVRFDASDSFDPDGTITDYIWDFGDSSTGLGKITTHSYNRSGSFTVTLTVTDDDGATDSISKPITAIEAKPPKPEFTFSPKKPLVGQSVTFDASGSSDPDGCVVNYEWDFGDGSGKNYAMIVTHAFTEEGTYTVTLTVTDDDGATASVAKDIKVLSSGGGGGPA